MHCVGILSESVPISKARKAYDELFNSELHGHQLAAVKELFPSLGKTPSVASLSTI